MPICYVKKVILEKGADVEDEKSFALKVEKFGVYSTIKLNAIFLVTQKHYCTIFFQCVILEWKGKYQLYAKVTFKYFSNIPISNYLLKSFMVQFCG